MCTSYLFHWKFRQTLFSLLFLTHNPPCQLQWLRNHADFAIPTYVSIRHRKCIFFCSFKFVCKTTRASRQLRFILTVRTLWTMHLFGIFVGWGYVEENVDITSCSVLRFTQLFSFYEMHVHKKTKKTLSYSHLFLINTCCHFVATQWTHTVIWEALREQTHT